MKLRTIAAALGLLAAAAPVVAQTTAKPPIVVAPGSAPAGPVDPASLALAHQILDAAFPPEKRQQMFSSMFDTVLSQARQNVDLQKFSDDKDFQALLDRSNQRMMTAMEGTLNAAIPDYFEAMARAYARDFSADDLNVILVFVKTPAGQHYFERSTEILKDPDVAEAGRKMTAQLMTKLPEITSESMKDVQAYVAKKEKQAKLTHAAHAS